jgi:hypothetical protein
MSSTYILKVEKSGLEQYDKPKTLNMCRNVVMQWLRVSASSMSAACVAILDSTVSLENGKATKDNKSSKCTGDSVF